jgi:hypothetical protein
MKTFRLAIVLLAAAGSALAGETPRERFWEAHAVLLKGDPASAAELFRTLRAEAPDDPVADDCLFWIGRCYLRLPDREPDAVVALNRLVREYPESPFLDDAARELSRLGARQSVTVLRARLERGEAEEVTARALAVFGEDPPPRAGSVARELAELRREVARLRKEVEEAIALLTRLLARRAEEGR